MLRSASIATARSAIVVVVAAVDWCSVGLNVDVVGSHVVVVDIVNEVVRLVDVIECRRTRRYVVT